MNFNLLYLLAALLTTSCSIRENVDLILYNGKIVTVDSLNSVVQALAVRDGRIIATGADKDIRSQYASMKQENLQGALVLPGFTDAHLHLRSLGQFLSRLNLLETKSYDELVAEVADRIRQNPDAKWIFGRGWDQNRWQPNVFPDNKKLSAVTPDNYVVLKRVDGHALLVNDRVLRLAGISERTADPAGGKILRDALGKPTGVLIDNAMDIVNAVIPPPTFIEDSLALQRAMQQCIEYGITSVHDAGVDSSYLASLKRLGKHHQLKTRVYAMLDHYDYRLVNQYMSQGPEIDSYNRFLTIRAIKLYADGALGSRGAALLHPYADDPQTQGLIIADSREIAKTGAWALRTGFQLCTHAIGNRGNRNTLDGYASAGDISKSRWRIEHAQIVDTADQKRFGTMGIIASMQPTHCTSDMAWVESRIGKEHLHEAYAWRSFMDNGTAYCFGSDAPVESCNPLWGIYAAVTRQDHTGKPEGGWLPEQRITVIEAIRGFTINAAYAAFEESYKGSIERNKLADLVVLSKDITTIPAKEILHTEVVMTIVDGMIVYRKTNP